MAEEVDGLVERALARLAARNAEEEAEADRRWREECFALAEAARVRKLAAVAPAPPVQRPEMRVR